MKKITKKCEKCKEQFQVDENLQFRTKICEKCLN